MRVDGSGRQSISAGSNDRARGSAASGDRKAAEAKAASIAQEARNPRVDGASGASRQEAVVVSAGANQLVDAADKGRAAASERVAQVKSAVNSGRYKVDHQRLAERLVDEESDRSSRR